MVTVSIAISIEKDFMDLALKQTTLNNLAESRLHRIQVVESLLEHEKTILNSSRILIRSKKSCDN